MNARCSITKMALMAYLALAAVFLPSLSQAYTPQEAHRVLTTGQNPFDNSAAPAKQTPVVKPMPVTKATPVPTTSRSPSSTQPTVAPANATGVNINTADAATLAQGLKGVGTVKAQAIVSYRQQHGPFTRIEDLDKVKGIGPATVEKNRALIRLR